MSPFETLTAGWYNIFYTLAVGVAGWVMFDTGRQRGWPVGRWSAVVAAWIAAGVVGAMLPHALFGDAITARTSFGAVILATVAVMLCARLAGLEARAVLDTTAVAIPLGAAVVRIGCYLAECCQGIITSLGIGIALHADDAPRHAVQLYEASLEVVLALLIVRRKRWERPGMQFLVSLTAMCAIRFATEFVRDNEKFGGLSLAQWVVLPLATSCLFFLVARRPVARPRRHAIPARHIAAVLLGLLGFVATTAGLPPLEASVLLLAAIVLAAAAARRMTRAAPIGLAALVLQVPPVTADSTYPRMLGFFGGGFTAGSYDYRHTAGTCEGQTQDWTRHHAFTGYAVEGGTRFEKSETRTNGFRTRGVMIKDDVGRAVVTVGGPINREPHTQYSGGISIVGDFDWRYLGLSAGASFGLFKPMERYPEEDGTESKGEGFMPALGLRLGPKRGISVETRLGDEVPTWSPGPLNTVTVAFGDKRGNRIRLGVSEVGKFVAARHLTSGGFEIIPSISLGDHSDYDVSNAMQGSVMVRKWFRVSDPK